MIPKSVSATSLTTAKLCLSRFWAENIEYARSWSNPPAMLGTCCHSALEKYVGEVYIAKTHQPSKSRLVDYFELYFLKDFGDDSEKHHELREAGIEMMELWFDGGIGRESAENHFASRRVLDQEEKKFLLIQSSAGPIKLNYILDRFDEIGPNQYEIVDYKSQFKNVSEQGMADYMQPDIYALAKFIEYPDAELMLVTFDLLRHGRTTIQITKERARKFFESLCELIEKIIATSVEDATETLNLSCNYCIRKASCGTLQKNIDVGGLFSLDLAGQIDLRTQIEMQVKGLQQLQKDLDEVVEETLGKELKMEMETTKSRAYFTTGKQNSIKDIEAAERIVGSELFFRYAKRNLTLKEFDKMVKDESLTDEQREQLKALKVQGWKDPKLNYDNNRGDVDKAMFAPDTSGKLVAAAPRAAIVGLD